MPNEHAVYYSFGLYVLYVLLPIIPAVVIFRLFPDTKVAVSGPLQNLSLKTTGAFGAYVVTAGMGFFLVVNVEKQIDDLKVQNAQQIEMSTPYKLRLNLLFQPQNTSPNPFAPDLKVDAYVEHPGKSREAADPSSYRLDRGAGGLVANFDNLKLGDKIILITKDGAHAWRSDDIVTPNAQVQMNPTSLSEQ